MKRKEKIEIFDELVEAIKEFDEIIDDGNYETLEHVVFVFDDTEYTFDNDGNRHSRERKPQDVVGNDFANDDTFLMVYDGGNMYSVMNNKFGYSGLHEEIDKIAEKHGYYFEQIYRWCSSLAQ